MRIIKKRMREYSCTDLFSSGGQACLMAVPTFFRIILLSKAVLLLLLELVVEHVHCYFLHQSW